MAESERLFHRMLTIPPPERDVALENCADDALVVAQVRRLLEADDSPAARLIDERHGTRDAYDLDLHPATIGPYKVLGVLGVGGAGVVYRAKQEIPVQRLVAVKVLHDVTSTRKMMTRFENERQVLASLTHPGVARLLDAGITESFRPYFVMELIDGVSIRRFARDGSLTTEEKIRLVIEVCRVIEHAHQRGVIHRDLKPSNVLVRRVDGEPKPCVIDFGIAKLVGDADGRATLFTETGAIIGTPGYMSPEQLAGRTREIDTRTDVYGLGVILYELLAGELPYDLEGLSAHGIIRAMQNARPRRPSSIVPELAGDLETILLRAVEQDPAERYESVQALREDLQRFLNQQPITARRHTRLYVAGKFIRRNRGATAFAAAVLATLMIASVGFGLLYRQAELSRREAVQIANDLRRGVFTRVPAVRSFHDDFEDGVIDERYAINAEATGVSEQDGKLVFDLTGEPDWNPLETNMTKHILSGDFDVEVSYELETLELPNRGANQALLAIESIRDSDMLAMIGIHLEVNPECAKYERSIKSVRPGDSCEDYGFQPLTERTGKLRLMRTGTRYESFFWSGEWVRATTYAASDEPAVISLGASRFFHEDRFVIRFDDLRVTTAFNEEPVYLRELRDDFSGVSIDPRFQSPFVPGHRVAERDGTLLFKKENGNTSENKLTLIPEWSLVHGDFDLSVEFALADWPIPNVGERYTLLRLLSPDLERIATITYVTATRSAHSRFEWRLTCGSEETSPIEVTPPVSAISAGAFRFRRRGAKAAAEVRVLTPSAADDDTATSPAGETEWITIGECPIREDDIVFEFGSGATDIEFGHTATFDNLDLQTIGSNAASSE